MSTMNYTKVDGTTIAYATARDQGELSGTQWDYFVIEVANDLLQCPLKSALITLHVWNNIEGRWSQLAEKVLDVINTQAYSESKEERRKALFEKQAQEKLEYHMNYHTRLEELLTETQVMHKYIIAGKVIEAYDRKSAQQIYNRRYSRRK